MKRRSQIIGNRQVKEIPLDLLRQLDTIDRPRPIKVHVIKPREQHVRKKHVIRVYEQMTIKKHVIRQPERHDQEDAAASSRIFTL
jgi:hypothetical protein